MPDDGAGVSMGQKVILFFSGEPGGAEVLIPAIRSVMTHTPHKVIVLGYGLGADRFSNKGIACTTVDPIRAHDSHLINTYQPDFIVSSATSLPERDMSEKQLWRNARVAGIPTLAFLDQWQNYAVRFSGVAADERLAYLPDYINCINETGKCDMAREGFRSDMLVKFGHPYLSSLNSIAANIDEAAVRQRLGVEPTQQVALFVSEAIREHFGGVRGYDQYDALRVFMEMVSSSDVKYRPLIKLHPKDVQEGYDRILRGYSGLMPVITHNQASPVECIQIADCVFGMTSIMLIEAFVLGKPVVSIQPGLMVEDPMILSREGYIARITDAHHLPRLEAALSFKSPEQTFEFAFREEEFLAFLDAKLSE